jgi:hypothetical protein
MGEAELVNFLDKNGRLKSFPSKRRYKIIALFYLASKFESGAVYTEKEINVILDAAHTFDDRCLLRRELYNHMFLGRLPDGSKYWLEEKQPLPEDFGL